MHLPDTHSPPTTLPTHLTLPLLGVWGRHKLGELDAVLKVVFLHWEGSSLHLNHHGIGEVLVEEGDVDGGRHEDDAQVGEGADLLGEDGK